MARMVEVSISLFVPLAAVGSKGGGLAHAFPRAWYCSWVRVLSIGRALSIGFAAGAHSQGVGPPQGSRRHAEPDCNLVVPALQRDAFGWNRKTRRPGREVDGSHGGNV